MVHVSRDLVANNLILIVLSVPFIIQNPIPKSGDTERIFYRKYAQQETWEENLCRVEKGRGLKKITSY